MLVFIVVKLLYSILEYLDGEKVKYIKILSYKVAEKLKLNLLTLLK